MQKLDRENGENGDILPFCLGSWASTGSQREFQAHAERGRHPRETHPAERCRGSKRGSKSLRRKLVRFLAKRQVTIKASREASKQ